MKSTFGVIDFDLLPKCDLSFLCEHWLTPYEAFALKERFNNVEKRWIHMNVNLEETVVGRPYSGVGFIGNQIPNVTYVPLHMDTYRITGVQLIFCQQVILTVFGVYVPFHSGRSDKYNFTMIPLTNYSLLLIT